MFSPGLLTSVNSSGESINGTQSHADFEGECARCHQPLKSMQAILCIECHVEAGRQLELQFGLHAKIESAMECYKCHTDHKGREFSPSQAASEKFDHSVTYFSLVRHQVGFDISLITCDDCHDSNEYTLIPDRCQECHSSQQADFIQIHETNYGLNCLDCHDGIDSISEFDHSNTRLPIDGKHAIVDCVACHNRGVFQGLSSDCVACHREPEEHAGYYNLDCRNCHGTEGWSPAFLEDTSFSHEVNTQFSLVHHKKDYDQAVLMCQDCHGNLQDAFDISFCLDCHGEYDETFMGNHLDNFGEGCLACHDGVDRMHGFDHENVFPIKGGHQEVSCESCHVQQVFGGIPTDCSGCHDEPDVHAGVFGLNCQYCHTEDAWTPAMLRIHVFPIDHGDEGDIDCEVCHITNYYENTCVACHEMSEMIHEHREEGIINIEGSCVECHPQGEELDD